MLVECCRSKLQGDFAFLLSYILFSEGENEVWYYSTKSHVEELMECLEGGEWERELLASLQEMRDDIMKHVAITEELTSTNKGSKKSIIEIEIGNNISCLSFYCACFF